VKCIEKYIEDAVDKREISDLIKTDIVSEINKLTTDKSEFKIPSSCIPDCYNTKHYKVSLCEIPATMITRKNKNYRIMVRRTLGVASRVLSENYDVHQNIPMFEEMIIQLQVHTPGKQPVYQNTKSCLVISTNLASGDTRKNDWLHYIGDNATSIRFPSENIMASKNRHEQIIENTEFSNRKFTAINSPKMEKRTEGIAFFKEILNGVVNEIDQYTKSIGGIQNEQTRIQDCFLSHQHSKKILSVSQIPSVPNDNKFKSLSLSKSLSWKAGPTYAMFVTQPYKDKKEFYVIVNSFNLQFPLDLIIASNAQLQNPSEIPMNNIPILNLPFESSLPLELELELENL
jgi:hypothetical protein